MAVKLSINTKDICDGIVSQNNTTEVTTQMVRDWAIDVGYKPQTILNRLSQYKSGRGKYNLDYSVNVLEASFSLPTPDDIPSVKYGTLVPTNDPLFTPFGCFKDVKTIIKSGIFYPIFITGLSGNGKTHSVEQSCSQLNRDMIRVNITIETDTDDLIGGFRLVDGNTVWHDGPVIEAMKRGAVLLLDEIDLASNKILCLQSVLEGSGYYIKKTNEWITPVDGFNVVATANTKGRSDDTGRYIGTNVLNEAFLERFAVTLEQSYPTPSVESKILTRNFVSLGCDDCIKEVENLVTWADIIRRTHDDGGIEDVITTRRLINIAKAYVIWGSMDKAIELCTNRFDGDTKKVFKSLYEKVSGDTLETILDGVVENKENNEINL